MTPDPSEDLYTVLFDERAESWYVSTGTSARVPLSRSSLQVLVSLYNEIHRGSQLTLIERRAMEELGEERRELHDTIRSLYDHLDASAASCEVPFADRPGDAPTGAPSHWLGAIVRFLRRSW